MTSAASDYEQFIKQYYAKQAGVNRYTDIFANMFDTGAAQISSAYNAQEAVAEQTTQKNISAAYSNYLQNQMLLKHAENLTTGAQNELARSNKFALDKTIEDQNLGLKATLSGLSSKEASDLATLSNTVSQQQLATDKTISDTANRMLGYENYLLKYAFEYGVDPETGGSLKDAYGESMFKMSPDGEKVIGWSDGFKAQLYGSNASNYTITDSGKEIFGYLIGSGFEDYLKTTLSPEKYSQYIDSDRSVFQEAMLGSEINPYNGNTPSFTTALNSTRFNEASRNDANIKTHDEYYGNVPLDESEARKIFKLDFIAKDYIDTSNAHDNNANTVFNDIYVHAPKTDKISQAGVFTENIKSGDTAFNAVIKSGMLDFDNLGSFSNNMGLKSTSRQKYDEILAAHDTLTKSGKLKSGDIFEINGYIGYAKDANNIWFVREDELDGDTRAKLGLPSKN